jgi:hypothetical protein
MTKILHNSEKIAKALVISRQAILDMEVSGLQLEQAISLLEANIKESSRKTNQLEVKTT